MQWASRISMTRSTRYVSQSMKRGTPTKSSSTISIVFLLTHDNILTHPKNHVVTHAWCYKTSTTVASFIVSLLCSEFDFPGRAVGVFFTCTRKNMNKLVIHLWMLRHKPYCNLVKLPTSTEKHRESNHFWQCGKLVKLWQWNSLPHSRLQTKQIKALIFCTCCMKRCICLGNTTHTLSYYMLFAIIFAGVFFFRFDDRCDFKINRSFFTHHPLAKGLPSAHLGNNTPHVNQHNCKSYTNSIRAIFNKNA